MTGPAPGSLPIPAPEPAASPASVPPAPRQVLLDTSVLAPEPLWLWTLALTEGIPEESRPRLLITDGVIHELRHALRRIDPRLDRALASQAAHLRIDSLTREEAGEPTAPPRSHVLDPDDAHLDEAALRLGIDVLVSDDVHAFAPLPDAQRGYALWTADRFLCALADDHDLDLVAAHARYRARLADDTRMLGLDPAPGSASHRLRRSRAHRFANRVSRALRRAPSSSSSPG